MISDLIIRMRSIFRRRAVEADLNDELSFHLSQLTKKFVHAGLAPDEAARRARIELGGMEQTREECRQARGVSVAEHLWQDTACAVRTFRRNPGFTAAVAISLGLGIGANTAVFSLIDAVMWRPVRVADPASLLFVGYGNVSYTFTYQQFRTLRRDNAVMADLGAYSPVRLNVTIDGIVQPTAEGQMVSGQYFAILGVPPIIGRQIGEEHDVAVNGHPVAMISHAYWKRRFDLRSSGSWKDDCAFGSAVHNHRGDAAGVLRARGWCVSRLLRAGDDAADARSGAGKSAGRQSDPLSHLAARVRATAAGRDGSAGGRLASPAVSKGDSRRAEKLDSVRREKVGLYSAATGLSDLRAPFAESLFILMGVVATGAADCLREHREPSAGPCSRPGSRSLPCALRLAPDGGG